MDNNQKEMKDIRSLDLDQMKQELTGAGFPAFRAGQLYGWIHVKNVQSLDEMTNLPADLKNFIAQHYDFSHLALLEYKKSALDGTQKFLFSLPDKEVIESVFMKYNYGNSVCISSQAGCRMGCAFCASTLDGLARNLFAGEMLEEIYAIRRITKEKISHVVVMGTGEPMDNLDNVLLFLHMLTDENGMHLSARNITVSTCGVVPGIRRFAREGLPVTLALSLHAVTDEKRRSIMPVANVYTIKETLEACNYYCKETGRRVSFEYSLIAGFNDFPEDAEHLAALAKRLTPAAHVNLIPVNPVKERSFNQPDLAKVQAFRAKLEKHKINVSIRRVLGRDIDGACGQLRHRHCLDTKK